MLDPLTGQLEHYMDLLNNVSIDMRDQTRSVKMAIEEGKSG